MINTIFYFVDNMTPERYAEMIRESLISQRTLVFAKDQKQIYMGGQSFGKMDPEDLLQMIHTAVENGQLEEIVYDDTEIRQRIQEIANDLRTIQNKTDEIGMTDEQLQRLSNLESNVTALEGTVNSIDEMTESEVNDLIDNAIDTSSSLLDKIKEHGIDNISSWSGWNDKMNSWASSYAVAKETDSQTGQQVDVKLSDLKLRQDSISQRVQALQLFVDEHETPISMEVLDALINQTVDTNQSVTNIKNKYAYTHSDDIEWMVSGFESQAGQGGSFAQIYSTDKSTINNNIQTATSAVKTAVSTDEDGIVSTAIGQILSSATNNDITSLSGLVTKVDGKSSVADIVASINDSQSQAHAAVEATATSAFNTNITSYGNRLASVEQTANANSAAISTVVDASTNSITASSIKNTLASDTGVWNDMKTAFATTVDGQSIVSSAKSSIAQDFNQASWEDYIAYVSGNNTAIADTKSYVDGKKALINEFASFIGENSVSSALVLKSTYDTAVAGLQASYETLDGSVVKKASVIAAINDSGESNVTINADKINLSGAVIAQRLLAASAVIGGFTIGQNSLSAGDNNNNISLSPSSGFCVNSSEFSDNISTTNSIQLNDGGLKTETVTALNNSITNQINIDGSGSLASGSLSWDAEGNLTIGNEGSVTFSGTDLKVMYNSAAISLNRNNSINLYTDYMQDNLANYYKIYGSENGSIKQLNIYPSEGLSNSNYQRYINLGQSGSADIHLNINGDATISGNSLAIQDGIDSVSMYFDNENDKKFTIGTSAFKNDQWITPNVVFQEGITANSFVKSDSSDNYILLAGGGTKALSDFLDTTITTPVTSVAGYTGAVTAAQIVNAINLDDYLSKSNGGTMQADIDMDGYNLKIGFATRHSIDEGEIEGYTRIYQNGNILTIDTLGIGAKLDNSWIATQQWVGSNYLSLNGGIISNSSDHTTEILPNRITVKYSDMDLDTDTSTEISSSGIFFLESEEQYIRAYKNYTQLCFQLEEGDYATLKSGGFVVHGGTSSQFLKADGSVDNNTYTTQQWVSDRYLPLTGGNITGNINTSNDITLTSQHEHGIIFYKDDNEQSSIKRDADNDLVIDAARNLYLSSGGSNYAVYIDGKEPVAHTNVDFSSVWMNDSDALYAVGETYTIISPGNKNWYIHNTQPDVLSVDKSYVVAGEQITFQVESVPTTPTRVFIYFIDESDPQIIICQHINVGSGTRSNRI